MKNFTLYSLFALLTIVSTSMFGQTLLLTPTSPQINTQSSNLIPMDSYVTVENTSASTTDVMIIRFVSDSTPGHTNFFCFGQACYGPTVDTSTAPGSILAGKDIDFKATVEPNGICGSDKIHYRFYDPNNVADSVGIDLEFGFCTAVGLNDIKEAYGIFNSGSNPANNFAVFNYNLPSNNSADRLVVYNMLGSLVKSMDIPATKGVLVLNTAELKAGVYFVSYAGQNGIKSSTRLVVKH
jgi:hypothetical protein